MKNENEFNPTSDMQIFTGIKTLKAILITKGRYNKYRGWEMPENEDSNEEVYLVEYPTEKDTVANHPNHEGYISMSPRTVFEKYYKPSETYIDRLNNEHTDLLDKISKLSFALEKEIVPESAIEVLTRQLKTMNEYSAILSERLEGLK